VVTADSGRIVVKKKGMGFALTFVDVTDWGPKELEDHPALVDALIDAGHKDLVDRLAGIEEPERPVRGGLGGVLDPVIESQSSSGSKKTGGRAKDRARSAGDR
jgi:hypothetical protein